MSRPHKPNPTPMAPLNLRTTGPMKPSDIEKRLGRGFRLAHKHNDSEATLDNDPCPHCGSPVEWAATSTTERGKVVPYVYARCQGPLKHAWGFSNRATKRDMEIVDTTPAPRPSAGTDAMAHWIAKRADELDAQIKALQELRRLAGVVTHAPALFESPKLPIPPNGDPTPPHRH